MKGRESERVGRWGGGWRAERGERTYPGQNNLSLIHHSTVEAFFSYTSRLSSH